MFFRWRFNAEIKSCDRNSHCKTSHGKSQEREISRGGTSHGETSHGETLRGEFFFRLTCVRSAGVQISDFQEICNRISKWCFVMKNCGNKKIIVLIRKFNNWLLFSSIFDFQLFLNEKNWCGCCMTKLSWWKFITEKCWRWYNHHVGNILCSSFP